jgi:Flp pilus assembly protein TadG
MIILRPLRRKEKGQALIEFALTALFVLLLIVGFLELILMVHTYNVLADAAKEGVRYAIVHGAANTGGTGPDCSTVAKCPAIMGDPGTGVVKTYAQYSLHAVTGTNMTVAADYTTVNGGVACNKSPCMVRITVSYPYTPFFTSAKPVGWLPTITVYAASQGRIIF